MVEGWGLGAAIENRLCSMSTKRLPGVSLTCESDQPGQVALVDGFYQARIGRRRAESSRAGSL